MIHKEGYGICAAVFLLLAVANLLLFLLAGPVHAAWVVLAGSFVLMAFILIFFRVPRRNATFAEGTVYAPADGRVVAVEETIEKEYFRDRRIQVSVFMSVWNVHVNWYPSGGSIVYYKYHPGNYLIAHHPKSSLLNERNTIVIKTPTGKEILVRQIAGAVARRIISYAVKDKTVTAGEEMGFIRFGSRVDVFMPAGSRILVKPGQQVRGQITPLAELK
jgi:phosphatidylserine decarboxylase